MKVRIAVRIETDDQQQTATASSSYDAVEYAKLHEVDLNIQLIKLFKQAKQSFEQKLKQRTR